MAIKDLKRHEDGISIETDDGYLKLQILDSSIIRTVYSPEDSFSDPESLMVVPQETEDVEWELKESNKYHIVRTSSLKLKIDKETCAFVWEDSDGNLLVREPENGGKSIESNGKVTNIMEEEPHETFSTKLELMFSEDEAIYGLGQHEEGTLNYRGETQYLYQHNMKASMPTIVSTGGYGILWDTYSLGIFRDTDQGSHFWTENDEEMVFYFVYGPEFDNIISGFRQLTGEPAMFPKWAYGYVQSKERYKSQDELISVVEEYRDRDIPLDLIVQDWQYWPEETWSEKYFDEERFPDPDGLTDKLHSLNTRLMISIWPNMIGGRNEEEMSEIGFIDEDEDLREPYDCNTYNPFDRESRELYWKQANEGLFSHGVDAWWCDSSEPYTADWTKGFKPDPYKRTQMNSDLLKRIIGPDIINAFSLMHSKGMYEGQREVTDEKRVVNLTRSGYPGQQRYGAITWSGDIEASWERLENQIADGLNFTISGDPKWTLDIGGFFVSKNEMGAWPWTGDYENGCEDEGYRELYVRWFQFGTFLPMFRSHGTDTPREVWRFGEPGDWTYDTLVKFDYLRYRLLPYIYSLAGWETHRDYTMYRNLSFDFREDESVHDIGDQFMFGPSLMVCPVTEPMYYASNSRPLKGKAKAREVYLPEKADWYDFWTGTKYEGGQEILADAPLEKIPIFVPEGSIIPMGPKAQYAEKVWEGPWEIRIYEGNDAEFDIYNDAGDGYDYEEGNYTFLPLKWNDEINKLTVKKRKGGFPEMREKRNFNLVKVDENVGTGIEVHDGKKISYTGEKKEISVF